MMVRLADMAFDIILFDPEQVPTDESGFRAWTEELFTREPSEPGDKISSLLDDARSALPDTTQFFADHDHVEITFEDADAQAGTAWVQDYADRHGFGIHDVELPS